MTAVRARDVVISVESFTDAHGDCLFTDVKMREARHQRARIEIVHMLLENADHEHAPISIEPFFSGDFGPGFGLGCCDDAHLATPDMRASTSNSTAKSFSARPMPRAAVSISLAAAVVGSGTSTWRPSSSASSISFCIILTLNQASSGMLRTN